jgi:hypothetical protein
MFAGKPVTGKTFQNPATYRFPLQSRPRQTSRKKSSPVPDSQQIKTIVNEVFYTAQKVLRDCKLIRVA